MGCSGKCYTASLTVLALVDCNSFYASCEQVFQPRLQNKPVIVLSNNDGCVVARSPQAKALGIGMGQPFFQTQNLCRSHKVAVFSSNYELYGDMSARVMSVLKKFAPNIEIYSVDEAFLDLSWCDPNNLHDFAIKLREIIGQWTGIPVSIGIAPTKTLAKLANDRAKTRVGEGVLVLRHKEEIVNLLNQTPVHDVWGIGSKKADKLAKMGVKTAWDFAQLDTNIVRQKFSVASQRTQWELQSIHCLGLEEIQPRKNIVCSRSFSRPVTLLAELEEAISVYVSRAAVKLRNQGSIAQGMGVFAMSSRFHTQEPQFVGQKFFELSQSSCITPELITLAKAALRQIYRQGVKYQKVGVMLLDLAPAANLRQSCFWDSNYTEQQEKLMSTVDAVNRKYGRDTLFYGAMGIKRDWQMKQSRRSPRYTTRWLELVTCR